jgi:hypothetical protein
LKGRTYTARDWCPGRGDLLRFPGVAHERDEWLDSFEWTPKLLAEYVDRASTLAARYGSTAPVAALGRWPRGVCQDCRRSVRQRWRYGARLLCERDAERRARVARGIEEVRRHPPASTGADAPAAPVFASYEEEVAWQKRGSTGHRSVTPATADPAPRPVPEVGSAEGGEGER